MKITFLLATSQNSSENRNTCMFAETLQKRGHEVHVVVTEGKPAGITSRLKGMLGFGQGQIEAIAKPPFRNGLYQYSVISDGNHLQPGQLPEADVLVATCWYTARHAHSAPLSKGTPVHFAQRYEGNDFSTSEEVHAAWQLPVFKIATSRKMADFSRKQLGVEIYHVIHNSIDSQQFNAQPRSRNQLPRVGFLYSDDPSKGTELALSALEQVRRVIPDLEAIAVSSEQLNTEQSLPTWIAAREVRTENDIRDAFSECDLWLHSSSEHEFGMIPLAAMACRCPVVSNPVGVMPELIENGRNGYTTYLVDDSALADAIERLIKMPEDKWHKLSDYARKTATSYDWEEAAELMEYTLMVAIDHDTQSTAASSELAVAA